MSSIYKLKSIENEKLEGYKKKAMQFLNEFFGKRWVYNTPKILIIDDRETIDKIREQETNRSIVGWFWGMKAIFILNPDNFETESSHKYSELEIERLISHELCHTFFNMIWGVSNFKWINEGISIYTSGQLEKYTTPEEFKGFLDPEDRREIYRESGSAIKLLIDRFGKDKLFEFFEAQKGVKDSNELVKVFDEVFEEKLDYNFFNSLLN